MIYSADIVGGRRHSRKHVDARTSTGWSGYTYAKTHLVLNICQLFANFVFVVAVTVPRPDMNPWRLTRWYWAFHPWFSRWLSKTVVASQSHGSRPNPQAKVWAKYKKCDIEFRVSVQLDPWRWVITDAINHDVRRSFWRVIQVGSSFYLDQWRGRHFVWHEGTIWFASTGVYIFLSSSRVQKEAILVCGGGVAIGVLDMDVVAQWLMAASSAIKEGDLQPPNLVRRFASSSGKGSSRGRIKRTPIHWKIQQSNKQIGKWQQQWHCNQLQRVGGGLTHTQQSNNMNINSTIRIF